MKKRLFCSILILVMVFSSTASVFGATSQTALLTFGTGSGSLAAKTVMQTIVNYLAQSYQSWDSWISLDADGNQPTSIPTFIDLYYQLKTISTFLTVTIENPLVFTIGDYIAGSFNYLASIDSTNQGINSTTMEFYSDFLSFSTRNHNDLANGLNDIPTYFMVNGNGDYYYPTSYLDPDEDRWGYNIVADTYVWGQGSSKLDFIAYMIQRQLRNDVTTNQMMFTDVDSTLSTWEYDTLSQTNFVPTSAFNGVYKYLAYLQRDIARLTYVQANQEDIDTRQSIKDSGIEGLKSDLYDEENGGMSLDNMTDTLSVGSEAKDAFDLGVGVNTSNIFSFTDDEGWGFWSTACENDMLNIPQTRSTLKANIQNEYIETPTYDAKMDAFWEGLGIEP